MKGTLKRIEIKEYETKDKKKFKKVEFTCDVKIDDKGSIKTYKGSYSVEFAKKYFEYCDVKTKDLIGKQVECILGKRSYERKDGEEVTITYIKFLNVLDENGNAIIMPKDTEQDLDF